MNFRTELLKSTVNVKPINHYCTAPPLGSVFGSAVFSRKKRSNECHKTKQKYHSDEKVIFINENITKSTFSD